MERLSTFFAADCASVTFDRAGRIVTICVGVDGPRLVMLDPRTLELLAEFPLPAAPAGGSEPVHRLRRAAATSTSTTSTAR